VEERYAALLARVIMLSVRDALAFLQEATPWAIWLGMCPVRFDATVERLAREYQQAHD
jgi:hypothetical protein